MFNRKLSQTLKLLFVVILFFLKVLMKTITERCENVDLGIFFVILKTMVVSFREKKMKRNEVTRTWSWLINKIVNAH